MLYMWIMTQWMTHRTYNWILGLELWMRMANSREKIIMIINFKNPLHPLEQNHYAGIYFLNCFSLEFSVLQIRPCLSDQK